MIDDFRHHQIREEMAENEGEKSSKVLTPFKKENDKEELEP